MRPSRNGNHGLLAWRQLAPTDVNAVGIATGLGLVWLLAYTFSGWARETTLSLVWQLEVWVADILGIAIRPPSATTAPNEPFVWAAILGAYCLASLWLASRAGRPAPSEEDLLSAEENRTPHWPGARGSQ